MVLTLEKSCAKLATHLKSSIKNASRLCPARGSGQGGSGALAVVNIPHLPAGVNVARGLCCIPERTRPARTRLPDGSKTCLCFSWMNHARHCVWPRNIVEQRATTNSRGTNVRRVQDRSLSYREELMPKGMIKASQGERAQAAVTRVQTTFEDVL